MFTTKQCWLLVFLQIERSLCLCAATPKYAPHMYDVPNKGTIKHEIRPHLFAAKRGYGSKKRLGGELFSGISTSCRLLVCGQLLLPSHDAVPVACEQHALQPLALAAASASVFLAVAHSCGFTASLTCLIFSKKFNIISALFVHQSLTLPQKIDSREGLFWCKKGWHATVGKMYFYLRRPPFAPLSGLFAAKFSAFWC